MASTRITGSKHAANCCKMLLIALLYLCRHLWPIMSYLLFCNPYTTNLEPNAFYLFLKLKFLLKGWGVNDSKIQEKLLDIPGEFGQKTLANFFQQQ